MAVPEQLQAGLVGRYRIERELGRGGMATVYLAQDVKHDRPVALKVLLPDLAAVVGPERFQREIRFAARLQHPHILTVHDSGETAGQLWFTMPFVEGESLRDRLRREHQLPVDVALRITDEAARALEHAHEHGIVHRDIKPENILLTKDGSTLVADFGIARALTGSDDRLTETGIAVGTVAYMSPEQASGGAVDARTDIYALGSVLYEMLAGEPPFSGPTAQAILAKRVLEPVPHVRTLRDSVPASVEQAVTRALAKMPADRFATAAEFARALQAATTSGSAPASYATTVATPTSSARPGTVRRPRVPVAAITLGLGFVIGLGVLFAWRHTHPAEDTGGQKRVAVLPFENLGDSTQAYFADGVGDEVRGKLSQVAGLAVIARASSNEYRHTSKAPGQIARELGANYLLTGTVRWEKHPDGTSRVRVSPELVRVEPGTAPTTQWQQPFDAALTDVFQVQADIATKVAQALDVAFGRQQEQVLRSRPTSSLEAYDAFLRGDEISRAVGTAAPAALLSARPYYERAVALDSGFALAWTRLARLEGLLYNPNFLLPADSAAAARAAARALALAPSLPDTRLALGEYYYRVESKYHEALEQFEMGLRLAPADGRFFGPMAQADQSLGRWDDAVAHARAGLRLDPRSSILARILGRALVFVRRYDEALAAADQALKIDPTSPDNVWLKAVAHIARGDLAGARAVYREASPPIARPVLVTYMSAFWEMAWTLPPADVDVLVSLSPEDFGGDRSEWGLCLAMGWALKQDTARARVYADSGRLGYEALLRANPRNDQGWGLLGLTLAYLGRYDDAIAAARKSLALRSPQDDKYGGVYNELQLARVYAIAGRLDRAEAEIEQLLKMPSFLSPGWFRIDPTFAALRGRPRFERLVNGS